MQHEKTSLDDARLGDLLAQMAAWEYDDDTVGLDLHVGDLGWELRQEEPGIHAWWDGDTLLAVAEIEAGSARPRISPRQAGDPAFIRSFADELDRLLAPGEASCDAFPGSVLRDELIGRGWQPDPSPWCAFSARLDTAPPAAQSDVVLGREAVEDRVAVQRAGFEGSTFTPEAWRRMSSSPAFDPRLDLLLRDDAGTAVAAGTAWSAGPGRPAILEPVATHRDHRGRGHGKQVVRALVAALHETGASSVTVCTPASNVAGTALYESAGLPRILTGEGLVRPA